MTPAEIAYELSTRYTPYIDGTAVMDVQQLAEQEVDVWWASPEALRARRGSARQLSQSVDGDGAAEVGLVATKLPLSGLHLALDPGHVGGVWAVWEWRNFRISGHDHWVREGELVLEVARRVRSDLARLGAKVTLLRESNQPINPKSFVDYWSVAAAEVEAPNELTLKAYIDYALAVRNRAVRMAIVTEEIAERARVVNEQIRPDALISLHINAAAWPAGDQLQLVDSDHAHVLVFGCLSAAELATSQHQAQLAAKLINGSGAVEAQLGAALGVALEAAVGLPASEYRGLNAIRIEPEVPYLWSRNLMLLRLVECPTILLEPYVANSEREYVRIQQALTAREFHQPLLKDDILIEYADAVVAGVLDTYGQ
ncbi:hypothetical protein ACWPKO_01060 [Coraliomargarita sp. W4R53]